MAFQDTRLLLATALDSVTGVKGHQWRPATVVSGSAWPRLVTITRGPGDAFLITWEVTVALGGEERTAANFTDDLWPELVDELEANGILSITNAEPVLLQLHGTTMHALQVTGITD